MRSTATPHSSMIRERLADNFTGAKTEPLFDRRENLTALAETEVVVITGMVAAQFDTTRSIARRALAGDIADDPFVAAVAAPTLREFLRDPLLGIVAQARFKRT
jgi:hypothetical protein